MNYDCKKLIEVTLPIKEIGIENRSDGKARDGHIKLLHIWWARRPLPVCRAVVFASLVPDPLDELCPKSFKDAVVALLSTSSFTPYSDIPLTAAVDPLDDNLRNRLLMFIGKFSDEFIRNDKNGVKTSPRKSISKFSLIKSVRPKDSTLKIAMKLLWVAKNDHLSYEEAISQFDESYGKIIGAEERLYTLADRHKGGSEVDLLEKEVNDSILQFQDRMPSVFDPFSGGGAIPLEAARMGCRSFGNDLNPVANLVQRGSLFYPQKYGKEILFTEDGYHDLYGKRSESTGSKTMDFDGLIRIPNRLVHDVEFYAKELIRSTKKRVGDLYRNKKNSEEPIAFFWCYEAVCGNPSCRTSVPLLKRFELSTKRNSPKGEWVYLKPEIKDRAISFTIANGSPREEGWVLSRKKLKCPCCQSITSSKDLKKQFANESAVCRLLAVLVQNEKGERKYILPEEYESKSNYNLDKSDPFYPEEGLPLANTKQFDVSLWGVVQYKDVFFDRQLVVIKAFKESFENISDKLDKSVFTEEYIDAILTYLTILINRLLMRYTRFNTWHIHQETVEKIFGRQAFPMVFDSVEMNPFADFSGSVYGQLKQMLKVVEQESKSPFVVQLKNASSGSKLQFLQKSIDATITDPPYYDAMPYADLSDFFYVWIKRFIGHRESFVFSSPLTPKAEECTAMRYHHDGSKAKAKKHFEDKLTEIFSAIETQTTGIVSVMFAHQSTEAWTTLCNSILKSKMNIVSSWAIDTEQSEGLKTNKSYLKSSVTVACKPIEKIAYADYSDVKDEISKSISSSVKRLYSYGFRGGDLLTSCFGQAVSVFGRYKAVEKANGDEVTVAELLELARNTAFKSIINDIDTDDPTRFYIGWLNLVGFSEEDHDMVRKITQMGLNIDTSLLETHNILISEGSKQKLADGKQRLELNGKLGLLDGKGNYGMHIDQVHRLGQLWNLEDRPAILRYLKQVAPTPEDQLWRVLTALKELLPAKHADGETVSAILANQEALLRDAKDYKGAPAPQGELF